MSDIGTLLDLTLVFSIILLIGSLSGYLSETVGVVNIGIDGMMCVGALFFGVFSSERLNFVSLKSFGFISAILLAMICTTIMGVLHAFLCINLKANHVVSGTAINLLGMGMVAFLNEPLGALLSPKSNYTRIVCMFNSQFHIKNSLYGSSIILFVFGIILCSLVWVVMHKTKIGLRYRAIGENFNAVDAKGINIKKYQWLGVILSSAFAGLAGSLFLYRIRFFSGNVQSIGYLGLAILIIGGWKIEGIATFSFVFAIFTACANTVTLSQLGIDQLIVFALPYIITLIILLFTSKSIIPPSCSGIPFNKEKKS